MSDLICAGCESRHRSVPDRLRRLKAPLFLMSLAAVPGLISFRVYESVPFAVVNTALTAVSIGAAAVLFRPR